MTDRFGNEPYQIIQKREKYVTRLKCGCEIHKPHGIHKSSIRKIGSKCKIKHRHLKKTQWWGEFTVKCNDVIEKRRVRISKGLNKSRKRKKS